MWWAVNLVWARVQNRREVDIMRERRYCVELTDKEMLLMAQAMYLAAAAIRNPGMVKNDQKGKSCVMWLLIHADEWNEYCMKMQETCIKAQDGKYL